MNNSSSKALHLHGTESMVALKDSNWHKDSIYPSPSPREYKRRHEALRAEMKAQGYDCLIVGGGSNLMSMWGGLVWLTGHMDHRSMAQYVVFPLKGEPTLLYPMANSHIWSARAQAKGVEDIRSVRGKGGGYGKMMVTRVKELGLETGNIGLTSTNMEKWAEFMPANYYLELIEGLPKANITFVPKIFHKLWVKKSPEELDLYRKAGELCDRAHEAVVEHAKPGVTERELAARAAFAMSAGGGYPHLCILGITSMEEPTQIFGNPNPSDRVLEEGDLINNELAAGYCGVTSQIGNPICVGKPTDIVKNLWEDAVMPTAMAMEEAIQPGKTMEDILKAGQTMIERGYTGRPILMHGMDICSSDPSVSFDRIVAEDYERTMFPGMVLMSEPNPITPDGKLGLFWGRTYIITENGNERVSKTPDEMIVL